MDQVKVYLEVLKKHHFWVLSGLIVLAAFIGWYLATGSLAKEFNTNQAKVASRFGTVAGVIAEDPHPNDQWKEALETQTSKLSQIILKTWQELYSKQKEKVLKWPKIDDEFLPTMQSLRPDQEIPRRMRDTYRYDVKRRFPELVQSIGALPVDGPDAPKRAGAGDAKQDAIVTWNSSNQEEITKDFVWSELPTSQQVRFAQEDLWAYTALLNVIKAVNEGATGNHNARLKKIERIAIGQRAADVFVEKAAAGLVGLGSQGPVPPPAPRGSASQGELANRYVDERGNPLAADSEKPKQFNRIPVFMRVTIDQRELGKFLVLCANSPLPIEVRQFRLESPEYLVSKGDRNQRGTGGGAGKTLDLTPATDAGYYDVAIEVFGIIYIFNPPDPSIVTSSQVAAARAESE